MARHFIKGWGGCRRGFGQQGELPPRLKGGSLHSSRWFELFARQDRVGPLEKSLAAVTSVALSVAAVFP